jgi:hypothetical protein
VRTKLILIREKDNEDYTICYRIEKDEMKNKLKYIKKISGAIAAGVTLASTVPLTTVACSKTSHSNQQNGFSLSMDGNLQSSATITVELFGSTK